MDKQPLGYGRTEKGNPWPWIIIITLLCLSLAFCIFEWRFLHTHGG
jgi:hypothetical protein